MLENNLESQRTRLSDILNINVLSANKLKICVILLPVLLQLKTILNIVNANIIWRHVKVFDSYKSDASVLSATAIRKMSLALYYNISQLKYLHWMDVNFGFNHDSHVMVLIARYTIIIIPQNDNLCIHECCWQFSIVMI